MDGVFMGKLIKRVLICCAASLLVWGASVMSDRQQLNEELIRFHVVANSDSAEDQAVKLKVRDAVMESLRQGLADVADMEAAKQYLQENLPKLQRIANETLEAAGFEPEAVVSLCREAFDTRYYDTFTLPAGVYESLRITIGEGAGHNWWCVAFPSLCIPATAKGFSDTAVGAGFSESLSGALTGEEPYELRFFLLDAMGRLENIFFEG